MLDQVTPAGNSFIHLINQCKKLLEDRDWQVRLTHCYREANRATDWLVNQAVEMNGKLQKLNEAPEPLKIIIGEDLRCVATPHIIHVVASS